MLDGPSVARALTACGVTHVVWVPDSELGQWEAALLAQPGLSLVRPCREGEALAIAAGLLLGGARPVVMIQCTGLFEAGDALRNVVHDLGLPLFLVVGVRSSKAHEKGTTTDNCPRYTEPVLAAWDVPTSWLGDDPAELARTYTEARDRRRPHAALLPE